MAPGIGLDRQRAAVPRPTAAWRSALCRHDNVRVAIGLWAVNVLLVLGDVIDQTFRTLWRG
jgi:hypothetical protein